MSTHICTNMGSINISLKREAYEFLKALKRADKSFSDVILEFRERKSNRNFMRFFGALKDRGIDWGVRKKRMAEFRKSFDKRTEETIEKMRKLRHDRIR